MKTRIINLETGQDCYITQTEPIPKGFEEVSTLTKEEWIEAVQKLANKVKDSKIEASLFNDEDY